MAQFPKHTPLIVEAESATGLEHRGDNREEVTRPVCSLVVMGGIISSRLSMLGMSSFIQLGG
jgi:hypothetical protein